MGVSPFGNPRIEAYLQLPAAYRSLSRPSSAPDAKAFTLCSFTLELSARSFDLAVLFFELLEFLRTFFKLQQKSSRFLTVLTFRLVSCGSLRLPLVEIVIFYPTLLKDQYFSILCPQYLFVSTLSLLFGFQ